MNIIVDIDGTIADCSHRRHHLNNDSKDWDSFFSEMDKDPAIKPIVNLINSLSFSGYTILMVTGRPERYREITKTWFDLNRIEYDRLYMRANNDFREDYIIKEEILNSDIFPEHKRIEFVIDDRQSVVDMWRRNGLICLQMEPGVI